MPTKPMNQGGRFGFERKVSRFNNHGRTAFRLTSPQANTSFSRSTGGWRSFSGKTQCYERRCVLCLPCGDAIDFPGLPGEAAQRRSSFGRLLAKSLVPHHGDVCLPCRLCGPVSAGGLGACSSRTATRHSSALQVSACSALVEGYTRGPVIGLHGVAGPGVMAERADKSGVMPSSWRAS